MMTMAPALAMVIAACGGEDRAAQPPPLTAAAHATPRVCTFTRPAACEGGGPSYARDVVPVLSRKCFGCHAGEGMAAEDHDFAKYGVLHEQREMVATQVVGCGMPPSRVAPLEPAEAATLLAWVVCGAHEN